MGAMPPRHADQLRQILEEEIASGQLSPGLRLEEVALAGRFGVSRTPIREALQMLSASGLVDLRPRRGAVVASLSLERLLEMFEVMAELEAVCGRLAARRMTDEERDELAKQHKICGQTDDGDGIDYYYRENVVFHGMIYAGAHNTFLAEEASRLQRRLQAYRRLQLNQKGRMGDSYAEHSDITEAIIRGDETAAAELLKGHVSIQADRFADWLSSLSAARLVTSNFTD
jgi:DNA-binding GntR family transcriptional regulator